jgi:hypothetical protein
MKRRALTLTLSHPRGGGDSDWIGPLFVSGLCMIRRSVVRGSVGANSLKKMFEDENEDEDEKGSKCANEARP